MYIAVGLGNPGEEYDATRHNTGRMFAAYVADLKIGDRKPARPVGGLKVLTPDTYMNQTGKFVTKYIKSRKAAEKLIVIYDDIDLPLGSMKISYNRGSGGHKGLESIIKAIKTREFTRIRIGITPTTPTGKLKKPKTEKAVQDFILGNFKPAEMQTLKKVFKRASEALEVITSDGPHRAMNEFN